MARSELEKAGGFFLVRVGDEEVRLPELPFGEAREWSRRLAAAFGPVFQTYEQDWKPGDGLAPIQIANEQAMDAIVDRIVEYDTSGVLGGRDGIAAMSTSRIHALYRELYEEAHPFDADLQATLMQMAMMRVNRLAVAQSDGASSTSGSSLPGDSLLPTSIDGSPLPSSSSSGRAGSNGNHASNVASSALFTSPCATRSSSRTLPRGHGKRRRT